MKKTLTLILILCAFASCSNDTHENQVSSKAKTGFTLDYFSSIPDTIIDGCADYYTYDTVKDADDKYIFMSDLFTLAVIKVNGEVIYMNKDTSASKEISDTRFIEVFKGSGYKAILEATKVKSYDEGGYYNGTLEISGKNSTATFKVHGSSGC